MKNKILLFIIMSLTAIILLAGCGSNSSENKEGSSNTFTVGLEAGYASI